MPTRPIIDIAGYHHIMNRGVDQMNVFRHNEDKDIFLQIVNKTAMIQKEGVRYFFGIKLKYTFTPNPKTTLPEPSPQKRFN
jgi:hypothetical protein